MAKLDDALLHLRGLPANAPFPPATHDELRTRSTRRRRRRGVAGSVLTVIVLLGAAFVGADRGNQVSTEPLGPSSTAQPPPAGLTVEPDVGLEPNEEVTLTLTEEPNTSDVIVAQCGSEATTSTPELWCSVMATGETSFPLSVEVQRVIQVSESSGGRIDCAERPGRCLIGVRTGGRDYTAPISFDPDLPALGVPTIDAAVQDNHFAEVTGAGYLPETELIVTQCRPAPDQQSSEPVFHDCDYTRGTRTTADADGRLRVELPLYQNIYESYTGWGSCDPCQIAVHGTSFDTIATRIDASNGFAGQPALSIQPAGPYAPGQLVELHGTGFPPATPLDQAIGWCSFSTEDPTTEAQGAGPGYANCRYPGIGPVETTDTGEFTIIDFPMPEPPFTCNEPARRCGLAIHPSEGSVPYVLTEFDMTP